MREGGGGGERESRLKYKYNKFERGSLYGAAPNDPETKESQLALKTRALVFFPLLVLTKTNSSKRTGVHGLDDLLLDIRH